MRMKLPFPISAANIKYIKILRSAVMWWKALIARLCPWSLHMFLGELKKVSPLIIGLSYIPLRHNQHK